MSGARPLPDWALGALRLIGLDTPSPGVRLHVELVNSVLEIGPGASEGKYITAMRFRFSWAKRTVGTQLAEARTDYEVTAARKKAALMLVNGFSGAKAQAVVDGDDEICQLMLAYRLVEVKEQAVRKFLDACDAAMEVWRAGRPDRTRRIACSLADPPEVPD